MNASRKSTADAKYMSLALDEARKGLGKTAPNPPVGAVLVRGEKILAKAFHPKAGAAHAEKLVFKKHPKATGATLYVTLEPCCHLLKKTPPCVPAILESQVKRVVVGCRDPNPQVAGRGIRALRRAGVEVQTGILQQECEELIRYFRHGVLHGVPYVTLKVASSLDGRVALKNGQSQWITSEASRKQSHLLRSQSDAILVGIGTVLQDDPRLNVRIKRGADPIRIVLDPQLRIDLKARVLNPKWGGATWMVTKTEKLKGKKAKALLQSGVQLLPCPFKKGQGFDLGKLLKSLCAKGVHALMVEGGSGVWRGFLNQGFWNELQMFVAPKIIGSDAQSWAPALGLKKIPEQDLGGPHRVERLGEDLWLTYRNPPKKT